MFSELELTSPLQSGFPVLLNVFASKKAANCQLLSAAAAKLSPLTCSKGTVHYFFMFYHYTANDGTDYHYAICKQ